MAPVGKHAFRKVSVITGVAILVIAAGLAASKGGWGGNRREDTRGNRARPFQAVTLQGETVTVAPGEHRPALLLFFCMCEDCHDLARQLSRAHDLRRPDALQMLGVVHGSVEEAAQFQKETGFPGAILADPLGIAGQQYGVGPCPNAWLVDPGGSVHFSRPDAIDGRELSRFLEMWPAIR